MSGRTIGPGTARARWAVALPALRAAGVPFLVSRAIVLFALGLARFVVTDARVTSAAARGAAHAGLLSWDASWYERIAARGYGRLGHEALRFFPLLPVLARAIGALPGATPGVSLIIVSNLASLAAFAVLYLLVVFELGDEACARRAVWLLALAPPAFVLVMGYAEPLLLLTSLVAYLGFRERRYGLAICAAFLAGLCRPLGVLLAIPAAIELGANWWSLARRERVIALGNFLLPVREQFSRSHRGGIADPFVTFARDTRDVLHGVHLGTAQHAPWAVLLVLLAAFLLWKLPASYGWYAVATLAVAITAPNLDSLERYGLGCFPFVIAAAMLTRRRNTYWAVVAFSGALLVAYAMLAFLGAYVP